MTFDSLQDSFAAPETAFFFRIPVAYERKHLCRPRTGHAPTVQSIRFLDWMLSRRSPATPIDVMDHFEVSRATAYRWLRTYADARCLVWPPRDGRMPARAPLAFPARPGTVPQYAGALQ